MNKIVRKNLTLEEKHEFLNDVDDGMQKTKVSEKFGIPKSTLSTILKNRDKIEAGLVTNHFQPARKRMRTSKVEQVEIALVQWVLEARSRNVTLTAGMLQEKARFFADAL